MAINNVDIKKLMSKPKINTPSKPGYHLKLRSPLARWAIIRAGGWAGPYGDPIGYHIEPDTVTNKPIKVPDFKYMDTRDSKKACKVPLLKCSELGCDKAGRCIGDDEILLSDILGLSITEL
jgi:hypothetical protein